MSILLFLKKEFQYEFSDFLKGFISIFLIAVLRASARAKTGTKADLRIKVQNIGIRKFLLLMNAFGILPVSLLLLKLTGKDFQ